VLSDSGVSLADVFVAQGKVLMGVARWEREQEEQAERLRTKVAGELKGLQLQLEQANASARLQAVRTEMEARSAEMAALNKATGSASTLLRNDQATLRKLRHADEEDGFSEPPGAKKAAGLKGKRPKGAA
jgi:short-subunit dehydrogenase